MNQIKKLIKMVNPFNNVDDVPMPLFIFKKVAAFFILYFAAAVLGEAIIIGLLSAMGYDPLHGVMPSGNTAELIRYYGFSLFMITAILYCKLVEKRTMKSMGFRKPVYDYISGAVVAVVLLAVIMGICCITGAISFENINENVDYTFILGLFGGFVLQGAAEEALSRGFLMLSLSKKFKTPMAIFISATVFMSLHYSTIKDFECKYAVTSVINLYLISIIFSLLMLCRTNIWIACGLHSVWNFVLYGVFGLTLSGNEAATSGILCFKAESANLINGGEYGIEASIITTIILSIMALLLYRYWKNHRMEEKNGI